MKNPAELTREELEKVVARVQVALYGTDYRDEEGRVQRAFDRNKVWDAETIEFVDEALVDAGLSPEDG